MNSRLRAIALAGSLLTAGCVGGAGRRDRVITVERRVAELGAMAARLQRQVDSLALQVDSLRRSTAALEGALRDREEQLGAARLELQRLKEIDLRTGRRPPDPS